ncbi:MAG TPA: DUF1588 domain-containing protein [Polyangiaceae bacterium]|nr:DUF1588 domain-containing protein [Polyangiaceae bacterium]
MRRLRSLLVHALALTALGGCESPGEPEASEPEATDTSLVALSPVEQLLRVSMAVRGKRPSLDDLRAIDAEPGRLAELTDQYLASDDFGATVREVFNEALKLRVPAALYPAGFAARGKLEGQDVQRINVSVTEAPLRLIEHVVREDLPLSEIVTADYVLADGHVAQVWGLPYSGSGTSWEVTHYEDGRPHAGILTDSWLYTRHSSTFSNKNRGRANAIARGLLCHDFTERHVELDTTLDLSNPEQVANAIESNPTCVSCHQTLDPLAAFFGAYYPLFVPSQLTAYPFQAYLPELAPLFTVKQPGYFGFDGGNVRHLGGMIAEDPRFLLCQAKRFYSYLAQVPLSEVPQARAAELSNVLGKNQSIRELVKAIVLDERFLVSHRTREDEPGEPSGLLRTRPWQLASSIADLTGYRWQEEHAFDLGYGQVGSVDMMTDSLFGFEVVSGGIDSVNVALPSHSVTPPAAIVLRGLAQRAAQHVVQADLEYPSSAKLFRAAPPTVFDEASVRAQLVELYGRVLGQLLAADSQPIDEALSLLQGARDAGADPQRAWTLGVFALLQHPRLAFY